VKILGVWDGHDAGAALLVDGRLAFAVNEERLTRRKLEVRFPERSIAAALAHTSLTAAQIDVVAFSTTDPAKTLGRWWPSSKERYYAVRRRKAPPSMFSAATRAAKYRITEWPPNAITRRLSASALRGELRRLGLQQAKLILVDHHEAHAAAAAWASGFERCAVITIDGLGDGVSATISTFDGGQLRRVAVSRADASLGVFFEHVTSLLNMRELEDEGKVMALADYAAPIADRDNPLLACVAVENGVIRTSRPSRALRRVLAPVHWRYPNEQFAFLGQRVVERTCVSLARDAVRLTGHSRLAIAGGVASNVKATRQVRLLQEVDDVYVFPHMGDGGLALGAAVLAALQHRDPVSLRLGRLDLGPDYDTTVIQRAVEAAGLPARLHDDIVMPVAELLAGGEVVMWFQGRMEYGPRALGHRSVLARPDRPELRDRLNLVLKRRVWYQPFCPSMLESDAARVLSDLSSCTNRNMTMAYEVAPAHRAQLAGVTSIDGTCRPQLVSDDDESPFAALLKRGRALWGIGAVLNTSFNIHGEPLVCSPSEAVDVFIRSGADHLAIGPLLVSRPSS
jgi:carbamoyltransferase